MELEPVSRTEEWVYYSSGRRNGGVERIRRERLWILDIYVSLPMSLNRNLSTNIVSF